MEEEVKRTRIYVGGIGERITSEDINKIFSSLGKVESVEIIRTKSRSFAYLDFSPLQQNSLSKLFSKYNGCVWKGGRLRLEKAKEHYLDRLKREWSQDAQLLATPPTPTPPQHTPANSNKNKNNNINIFFPRFRKLKSLPLSGTGKHKYSFQRVEAPPLPTCFCDCEEHLGTSLGTAQEKENHDLEEDDGVVIDEQELHIMNSVMSRIFERENVSNAAFSSETGPATENETNQDNLVTNVVSRGNNLMALSRCRQNTTISRSSQKLPAGETQSSKDRPTQNELEVRKMNISPPTKKRKSLLNEESIKNESVSSKPVGDLNMQTHPNKLMKKASAESQSGCKQSNTSHSWSQKLSWRKLVGDKDSSIFSVSNILPTFTPTKEVDNALESIEDMQFDENEVDEDDLIVNVVSKKNNMFLSGNQEQETISTTNQRSTFSETQTSTDRHDQRVPNKKRKSLLNGESDRKESVFTCPEADGNLQTDTNESGMPTVAQPAEPELHVKQSTTDRSLSQKLLSVIPVGDQDNDAFNVSNKLLSVSANEGQTTSDGPDVADATDSENQSLVRNENLEGKSDEKKIVELPAEAQPINNDAASNKSGRGSTWYQKSSWTQLVNEDNSSFSITQISPSITFEKHGVTTPYVSKDAQNLNNSKLNDFVKHDKKEGARDSSTALECKKAGGVAKNSSEKNKQTVLGDGETSALSVENKNDPMHRQTSHGDVRIGETCSFMRSAASIKEWAKMKAALSSSDKKKSVEK